MGRVRLDIRPAIRTLALLEICLLAGLQGCGEILGEGSYESGCVLRVEGITLTHLNGNDTADVDVQRTGDCDGDFETIDPEPYTDHNAKFSISNNSHPNGLEDFTTATEVTIRSCRVSFYSNSYASVPLETEIYFDTFTIQPDQTLEVTGFFFPLVKKDEFLEKASWTHFFSGYEGMSLWAKEAYGFAYFVTYTATFVFYGTDAFGNNLSVTASAPFEVGSFDNCD